MFVLLWSVFHCKGTVGYSHPRFLTSSLGSTAAVENQGDTNCLLQPGAGTIPSRALTQFPRGPCTSSAASFPYSFFPILIFADGVQYFLSVPDSWIFRLCSATKLNSTTLSGHAFLLNHKERCDLNSWPLIKKLVVWSLIKTRGQRPTLGHTHGGEAAVR